VREYPLFVRHGSDRIAAVLSVPESGPLRGLVLQLMGVGPDEIVGSMMFQRMARRLADRGLASLRLDYAGTGDSTGTVSSWSLAELGAETEQARTALQTARDAIEAQRFAVAGICYGGRIALELIKDKDCVGALCMSPPVIEYGTWTKTRRKVRKWKLVSYVKSNQFLRTVLVRPLRRAVAERKPTERAVQALGELDHARVLYLWSESEVSRDYSRDRAAKRLVRLTQSLPAEHRARHGVQLTPTGPLSGFDLLSPGDQVFILDLVVEWLDECFNGEVVAPLEPETVTRALDAVAAD
jgi:dienelactone hydrolase